MTADTAKRVVVGSLVATGGLAATRDLTRGQTPKIRIFIGVLAVSAALAALSEAAPELAAMLALLMLSTAVFTAGTPVFSALARTIQR